MNAQRRTHAQARAEMAAGLLREGRAQLDEVGAAQLSLREIARSLGVASSALYRHVASRDELLTLLIADAYTELADTVDAALATLAAGAEAADDAAPSASPSADPHPAAPSAGPGADPHPAVPGPAPAGAPGTPREPPASGLEQLGRAMRAWAVAHPRRWALLYGSPVPGYAAPAEETTGAGTRVMQRFLGLVSAGSARGAESPSQELGTFMKAAAAEWGLHADAPTAVEAVGAWTSLVGTISAEVFGQLGPELTPLGGELLERELARITGRFGLASPGDRRPRP
jgi:AcrR family transcriptional regulator